MGVVKERRKEENTARSMVSQMKQFVENEGEENTPHPDAFMALIDQKVEGTGEDSFYRIKSQWQRKAGELAKLDSHLNPTEAVRAISSPIGIEEELQL